MSHTKRPTLQDIADLTGVTKMTVSRYLRDPNMVSPPLRDAIQQAVEALGYIPSRAPDILSRARSHAIGVLLPSISNQVFSALIRGVESVTEPAGYQTLYAHFGYDPHIEEARIATLLSFHVDGLILSETLHTDRTLRMIQTAGIPVVEVMETPAAPIDLAVGLDHVAAARAMTEAMIATGKRHIVYLAARLDSRTRQRIAGYSQALASAGLPAHVVETEAPSTFTLGSTLAGRALAETPELDGLFCTNDDIAAGAMLACQQQGRLVPDDVAIAGYNALDIGQALSPRLASVITPREAIGRVAAERLLGRLAGRDYPDRVVDLGYTLALGGSVVAPSA
ncbi:substrate-binding domain-containing protein [Jeongeupia naejangsanensis]|uniref:Substrate-binding domain-containing protein n=1 Tax=Jeongeupia naejangsanensis TaxID=613195 RepID=A0ABS2BI84_9NEIS|nr:substrate-binding domain-containing protein [Jeongeupia naejangsanensis]MBM3114529.1 substrate-binding domain-containing protein [Jeongeupia naejangsanensis]